MSDDKLEEIAGAFFPESAERFSRCRAAVGRAYDLGRADWDKERERADDHDSARQSEKERADYAEAGLARLKAEYAAAIERGMRATAELQAKLAEAQQQTQDMILERDQLLDVQKGLEAEVERLREIKAYAVKAYEELRADLTAKIERLEHELSDAKRSRDDAIGRYVEAQAEPALSEKP